MLRWIFIGLSSLLLLMLSSCETRPEQAESWAWETLDTNGEPTPRHEASFVEHDGKFYLIGGRRINPVDIFDPATQTWTEASKTPLEVHHVQGVSYGNAIYLIGAMTGGWPAETPLERILIYYPKTDTFEFGPEIPEHRRRGGAGVAVHNDQIYVVGGITNGHIDGTKPWLDVFDPKTGEWISLPDAPQARDHVAVSVLDDKLYVFGGRRTLHRERKDFQLTTKYGDVFDLKTREWRQPDSSLAIPTERAGTMALTWGDEVVIGGGESGSQMDAHRELDAYSVSSGTWRRWPDLNEPRHGTGFVIHDGYVYAASGCAMRGGEPELATIERLRLPEATDRAKAEEAPLSRTVHNKWHTLELDFAGPETSEKAELNPFTDIRLVVDFTHESETTSVRGFYAGDGNAAETSAESGNVWRVRFSPNKTGEWTWAARLETGSDIAIAPTEQQGEALPISTGEGTFLVQASDADFPDLRAHGRIVADGTLLRASETGDVWIKGGANSPENLFAFEDFDGTYRLIAQTRENEAATDTTIHTLSPHLQDWRSGDPVWQDGKGKALIGAMNYLSSKGMNSVYFLTMNIGGDGNDVWPYADPSDFTRFDVSKLDQWEIVFSHMQARGILLQIVLQETENELLLDDGETGRLRRLYFSEMVARFGHHPGLVWNMGEENGPAEWMDDPYGQNTQQRKDMAAYMKSIDPYNHPVLLHSHAGHDDKDHILEPLLGFEGYDGLSFQEYDPESVNEQVRKWIKLSTDAGQPWLITMDEIGPWNIGANTDANDPGHTGNRRHVLWGSLMGGGAGVEWYFGAHTGANDLTTEDWRGRDQLWDLTYIAMDYFRTHSSIDLMTSCESAALYCAEQVGVARTLYIDPSANAAITIPAEFEGGQLAWYDPMNGGELIKIETPLETLLPSPPTMDQDWVALLQVN